jgi:hypothetical protein
MNFIQFTGNTENRAITITFVLLVVVEHLVDFFNAKYFCISSNIIFGTECKRSFNHFRRSSDGTEIDFGFVRKFQKTLFGGLTLPLCVVCIRGAK